MTLSQDLRVWNSVYHLEKYFYAVVIFSKFTHHKYHFMFSTASERNVYLIKSYYFDTKIEKS